MNGLEVCILLVSGTAIVASGEKAEIYVSHHVTVSEDIIRSGDDISPIQRT